jgi:hypothetical protein
MLDPEDLQYAAEILQDENQSEDARAVAEELVTDHLAEAAQFDPDPEAREQAMQALDQAGYTLEEPGVDYAQQAYDQQLYDQQVAEAAMSVEAAQQRGHEAAAQKAYERDLQAHMEASIGALEQRLGRPLNEIEFARTMAEAGIQHQNSGGEFPDLLFAHEAANYNHMQETDTTNGRVQSMVANATAMGAANEPEWTQERVNNLQERDAEGDSGDAHRARVELMTAQLEGNVGTASDEQQ